MLLYEEAARVIRDVNLKKGSIKNLVLSSRFKNKKQLYAIVCESLKYSCVTKAVIQKTSQLQAEKLFRDDEELLQVLLYDHLVGKGITGAVKYKAVFQKYKSSLHASCERLKIQAGVQNLKDLISTENQRAQGEQLPKYGRINRIKADTDSVIKQLENDGWKYVQAVESYLNLETYQFTRDIHIPDLLVFAPGTDLHDDPCCLSGEIIQQDKASCFPALILSPPEGAEVLDCCAAPGNKTSHVASLLRNKGIIHAFDRDVKRLAIMKKLISNAGVTCASCQCQDFLSVDPKDQKYSKVEYILVDPSCSGSGIVSRLNQITDDQKSTSKQRLQQLSRFQISILKHALRFPSVKKIVYSTCSIHTEENEAVIEEVLDQVKDKFDLEHLMPDWPERGHGEFRHAQFCLRMSPDQALTNGFFVASFIRKSVMSADTKEAHSKNVCKKKRKKDKIDRPFQDGQEEMVDQGTSKFVDAENHILDESVSKTGKKKRKKDKKDRPFKDSQEEIVDCVESKFDDAQDHSMDEPVNKLGRKKKKKSKKRKMEDENESVNSTELTVGSTGGKKSKNEVKNIILEVQESSEGKNLESDKEDNKYQDFSHFNKQSSLNIEGSAHSKTRTNGMHEHNSVKKRKDKKHKKNREKVGSDKKLKLTMNESVSNMSDLQTKLYTSSINLCSGGSLPEDNAVTGRQKKKKGMKRNVGEDVNCGKAEDKILKSNYCDVENEERKTEEHAKLVDVYEVRESGSGLHKKKKKRKKNKHKDKNE